MSYINYKENYPTIVKYKEKQNVFNIKLREYLALEDKYNKLVKKQLEQAKWSIVPGQLNDVFAGADNSIWGYNSSNDIYTCKKPCKDGNWKKTDGKIKNITGDRNNIYGIGMNDYLYQKPQDNSEKWVKKGVKQLDMIASNSSNSIVGVRKTMNVQLRISVKCDGAKDTYDESVQTKLSKVCVQKSGANIACVSSNSSMGSNTVSVDLNFNTTSTQIDNVIITISNSTKEIEHELFSDIFSGSFKLENPFKKEHVKWPNISYLRVERLEEDNNYHTLYESNLSVSTGSGTNNYGISLGNGILVGYNMFQCSKPCDDNNWEPIKVDKQIQSISADESYIYMTDSDNILWRCAGGCSSGNWERDPIGTAKKVDASGSKYLRVIGTDNMLWERDKRKWGAEWTPTNKVISNMSMSNNVNSFLQSEDIEGTLWTIQSNNNIEVALRPPWQKWRNEPNMNATVGLDHVNKKSTEDWDFIGSFENYEGCKLASLNTELPYNKITYFNDAYNAPNLKKTCWGNKIGKKYQNKQDNNAITGYPPYGYTKLGGLTGFEILEKMKTLNKELIQRAKELETITLPNNTIAQSMIVQKTAVSEKMKDYVEKLKKDRKNITLLEKQTVEINAENENSKIITTQKQSAYAVMSIITIILIIITIKQMKK